MPPILHALILGLVEGITEFLPVSSTGHLIIINQWISFGESFTKVFDIIIQLGAILAVVCYFWSKLNPLKKSPEGKFHVDRSILAVWKKIFIAVIPTLVIGALFGNAIQKFLFNPIVVACALIVGGIALIIAERVAESPTVHHSGNVSAARAMAIGFAQCFSFIPGISRSAATIIGGLSVGLSRRAALEFSFFLAVPTLVAASAYSLLKSPVSLSSGEYGLLAVGFITAFLVAIVVIRFLMDFIEKKSLTVFGYYRIVLGVAVLIYFMIISY